MTFAHRLPVVLSSGVLLSASLLAVAQDVPRAARGATLPVLTGVPLTTVESMDGVSFSAGYQFFAGTMTLNSLNGQVLLGSPDKVFTNNGTGAFTQFGVTATSPGTIQIPDLNGDGIPDFVVDDPVSAKVFLGNSDGTRGAEVDTANFALGTLTGLPDVANFISDGANDLLLITHTGGSTKISLLAGVGSGASFAFYSADSISSTFFDSSGVTLPVLARQAHWASNSIPAIVFASTSYSYSYTSVSITVRTGGGQTIILPAPSGISGPALKVVALTVGDIDGDGSDDISVILSSSEADLSAAITLIYKGDTGSDLQLNPSVNIGLSPSAAVIVPDVTGDGFAEIIGAVPFSGTGIFTGRGTFFPDFIALSASAPLTPSRTLSDPVIGSVGAVYRPQAVPLLTPDAGNAPFARQLLLGDYSIPATVNHPLVIPALQPSFVGVSATPKLADRPAVAIFDPQFALVFGNAGSTVQMVVTLSNAQPNDTLVFDQVGGLGGTISRVRGTDLQVTFAVGSVVDYNAMLRSMKFQTSGADTTSFATRTLTIATTGAFSTADGAATPYASTVQVATINTEFVEMGSVKAGGTLTKLPPFPPLGGARGFPSFTSSVVIVQQPANGTAFYDSFKGEVVYTSFLTAGAGTDVILVDFFASGQHQVVPFTVVNVEEPLGILDTNTLDIPSIGKPSHLRVYNGHAPYQVSVQGGILRRGTLHGAGEGINVDAGLSADVFEDLFVTPTNPFSDAQSAGLTVVRINVVDADGTPLTFNMGAVPLPAPVSVPSPQIPVSVGGVTLFGAICPSTFTGVQSLRTALTGKDKKTVRAFAWDAAVQSYVELPEAEPTGGLQPTTGVFLATRENLGLDFSGVPSALDSVIELLPGWNFVGLGPIDNAGTIERTHPFVNFAITDDAGAHSPADVSANPFYWDGTKYSAVSVMDAGASYWIHNNASVNIHLVRKATAQSAARSVRASGSSETPPAPPSTGAAASNKDEGGSCGSGSGIALVLGGLLAFARFARFRR